jgi:epsin
MITKNIPCIISLNQVKPKTDVEARVYEVLSHKNWGAASSIMNQIARDTWDYEKFAIITRIMWENVETQRPSAWRVIFKGLTLLEHLVKNGSERCVDDARNHGHVLRKLQQFNYYEGTIDRGLGVREKTKQLTELLGDNDRIREERQKAKKLREKFQGKSAAASGGGGGGGYSGGDGWSSSGGGGGWDGGGGKDDWNSGGGGGYASGGIDSGKNNFNSGARGRYDDDRGSSSAAAAPAPGPTFAQLPPATTKQTAIKPIKKTKKKKVPVSTPDTGVPSPGPGKLAANHIDD